MACFLLTVASSAFAQRISVGIKAGVPLTDIVETNSSGISGLPFQAQTRRYTIGPVVDIALPLGFGLEFGAMYKRFDQKSVAVTITGFTPTEEINIPIEQRADISAVGHSWEFPAAVQYRFFQSSVRPYVEGGISVNHLGNVYDFASANASFFSPTPTTTVHHRAHWQLLRTGWWLVGMGVDLKFHVIHVTPGLRYTHYNEKNFWLPSTNAVDFLVGFTF